VAVRQGPDGLRDPAFGSYQRPREKKPRSARITITIRMIQRMLTFAYPFRLFGADAFGDRGG
jgi:hypothetical protein